MPSRQESVEKLITLLEQNPELKKALTAAIKEADEKEVKTLNQFYSLLDEMLTHIPTDERLDPETQTFWAIMNKAPCEAIKTSEVFNEWIRDFIMSMGKYMDTTESAKALETFINDPKYKIEEYFRGPSGWLTYNQFMARQVKPGKRPVAERCNDEIIVAPTDSKYLGNWKIEDDATLTVKGDTYNINDLLAGSRYTRRFKGGIFTHFYLSVVDYHRYHTPVGGKVVEVKNIPGRTWTNMVKKLTGTQVVDDVGFQFNQTRGYIILKTDTIGYVAVVPIGMGFVSSVNITVDEGVKLAKGDEFGFFAYGGSDIIMLFEPDKIKFTTLFKKHYSQGEKIAKAIRK